MADDRRPRPPAPPPGLAEERAAFTPAPAPAGHAGWDDSWTWETMPAALRDELERRSAEALTGPRYTTEEVMAYSMEVFRQLVGEMPEK